MSSVDELLQLAAAGLLGPLGGQAGGAGPARQPSAGHPPLAAERSVPLAPHPSLDGAVDAALAAAAGPRSAACTSRGSSPLGAEQHLPLSAFQATGFTPFASGAEGQLLAMAGRCAQLCRQWNVMGLSGSS